MRIGQARMGKVCSRALVGALALSGCGDDTSSGSPTDAGVAAATVSCVVDLVPVTGAGATSVKPEYTCDAMPSTSMPDSQNACRNDSDCEIIESDMVRDIARICGLSCRGETDCDRLNACNNKCVTETTAMKVNEPGLSAGCAGCYAQIAACALERCLSECAGSADAPECIMCSFTSGCRLPFEACSGLDRK